MNKFSSFISHHSSLKRKRSFTLIELLVVIAIIAILAGILLPALNNARKNSMKIACTNKLKQLGTKMFFYIQDFNEWIPPYYNDKSALGTTGNWANIMFKGGSINWAQDHKIFFCPVFTSPKMHTKDYLTDGAWAATSNIGSYGFCNIVWSVGIYKKLNVWSVHDNLRPSTCDIFSDSIRVNANRQYYYYRRFDTSEGAVHQRHRKRANVTFMDGHVQSLTLQERKKLCGGVLGINADL